jgi:predicted RNA-binding protein YlqC (UPF0109 family)
VRRYERLLADQQRELQRMASLTAEEARDLLIRQIETDARRDAANLVKRLENEAREIAAAKARQIVTEAIQRSAAEHAIETTVSVVDLPSDDMKGRIIGREGRNIRALELATGEAMIVQAADAISAARPGARRDILESYVKRLEKLEGIADSFQGVSKAFALQAGREIRILVESERVTDEEAIWLSKDIARRIENELQYPGQIKVTVIRETRAVDYAR